MRLINADAFIKMMEEKCDPESTLDPWVLSVCRGGVKIMPTVDAVPVIRCKDCKSFSHGYCRFHEAKFVNPKAYCFWGERKDGEQHES